MTVDPDCSVCQEEEKAKAKAGALEGAALLSSAGHGHSHGHSEHAHEGGQEQEHDSDRSSCSEEGHGHVRIEDRGYCCSEKLAGLGEGLIVGCDVVGGIVLLSQPKSHGMHDTSAQPQVQRIVKRCGCCWMATYKSRDGAFGVPRQVSSPSLLQ